MTTWEQLDDGRFILREHNCPILKVAQQFDHPCRCEIDLLREILEANVERVNHIPDGDIACVYEIQAPVKSRNHR
jgi:predicted ArsR family transcriptional regulator